VRFPSWVQTSLISHRAMGNKTTASSNGKYPGLRNQNFVLMVAPCALRCGHIGVTFTGMAFAIGMGGPIRYKRYQIDGTRHRDETQGSYGGLSYRMCGELNRYGQEDSYA
jgi:hypothetical protein